MIYQNWQTTTYSDGELDIEIIIDFDYTPAEATTRHYQGSPIQVEIKEIKVENLYFPDLKILSVDQMIEGLDKKKLEHDIIDFVKWSEK